MSKIISFFFIIFLSINNSFALEVSLENKVKIENYLNSINNISADFIQINSDGTISSGKFFLQKPGRFRWEYNDQPLLIIANRKSLIYYDTELEQANYIPIKNSIAALITRKTIKLDKDIRILQYKKTKNSTKITLEKRKQKDIGQFSFIFKHNPFELDSIEITDNNNQFIKIVFRNKKINSKKKLPRKLFRIIDPRLK